MSRKSISPADLRVHMLDILQSIHDFCDEKGLRYYLAFGTLIGAVRHHGFIPWDDDIDIWMPRPDLEVLKAEFNHPHYKVLSAETDRSYPLDFVKAHDERTLVEEDGGDGSWGIFVDIFPLDGVPGEREWKKLCKKVGFIRHLVANQRFTYAYSLSARHGLKKNLSILAGRLMHPFLSLNRLLLAEDRIMKTYNYDSYDWFCDFTDLQPHLLNKNEFSDRVLLNFENRRFYAPKAYDKWLTILFGDYMTPPPPEKQISLHGIQAFWIVDQQIIISA